MARLFACLLASVLAAPGQPSAAPKHFDVAAIKPNTDNDNRFMLRRPVGGAFRATGVTLRMLILNAYDVHAFQVSNDPGWVRTERWDIEAKAEDMQGIAPMDVYREMLRGLLEDRFQLKLHRETKELAVYELVVTKNGSKLVPHKGEGRGIRTGPGSLSFQSIGIAGLAAQLSMILGRAVIDKTGLAGEYDFTLQYAPEPGQGGPEALGLPPQNYTAPPVDPNRPSIFTAVQEQLGLRLESQKGQVEILVVDQVERPSEN
jgi:uncharacterized protein (TIGR03435 family)